MDDKKSLQIFRFRLMQHSVKQKLVFYKHINQCIDNPHLSLYIRELEKGQDVATLQYLKRVPPFVGLKQEGYELLLCYRYLVGDKSRYIENTLDSINIEFTEESWYELKDRAEEVLERLNLPNVESGT